MPEEKYDVANEVWGVTPGDSERKTSSEVYRISDRDYIIANVICECSNPHVRKQDLARAQLIAKSPQLLKAARQAVERLDATKGIGACDDLWVADPLKDLRQAILDATTVTAS